MNRFLWSFIIISVIITIYDIFGQAINDGITYFIVIVRNLWMFFPKEVLGLIIYIAILLLIKYASQWK